MSFKKKFKNHKYFFITLTCLFFLFLFIKQLIDSNIFGEFTNRIIKLTILDFGLLVICGYFIARIIINRDPIKKVNSILIIILIKSSLIILLAMYIYSNIIPLTTDLIRYREPGELIGAVDSVKDMPFGLWYIRRTLRVDNVKYILELYSRPIQKNAKYKIYYLPRSKKIIKIEELIFKNNGR